MTAISKLLAASAFALTMGVSSAQATVFIALQLNNGAIVTVVDIDPDPELAVFSGGFGTFNVNLVSGSNAGVGNVLLDSTTNNASTNVAGVLDVYVLRNFIAGPLPAFGYLSSFTTNQLPAGWTVRQRTYADAANGTFGGGTLLGDVTFNASNSAAMQFDAPIAGAGPYSVTTRYTIMASGEGSSLSTITLSSVAIPEPGTGALMIGGFAGAGAMLRSRRRRSNMLTA